MDTDDLSIEEQALRRRWGTLLGGDPTGLEITYHAAPRGVVLSVFSDGSVLLRTWGGPIRDHGAVMNIRSPTVPAWRAPGPPGLHRRVLSHLREAGFPIVPDLPLYPGEAPALLTVRHPEGATEAISMIGRVIDAIPSLREIARELDRVVSPLSQTAPTEHLANPELARWPAERPGI